MIDAFMRPAIALCDSFSWIGAATHIIKIPFVDVLLAPVADNLGMGTDLGLIKCALSFFLIYPMAALFPLIGSTKVKHMYSAFGGFFLMQWIFGEMWIHSFLSSTVTYLICLAYPNPKQIPAIVFYFTMAHVTACHVYYMYTRYLELAFDVTGTQMVMVMKLTTFAYNLYDGTVDHHNTFVKTYEGNKGAAKVYAARRKFAIKQLPSLLEYYGYIYTFPCIIAGPAFEFSDYMRAIEGTAFLVTDPDSGKSKRQHAKGTHASFCFSFVFD